MLAVIARVYGRMCFFYMYDEKIFTSILALPPRISKKCCHLTPTRDHSR